MVIWGALQMDSYTEPMIGTFNWIRMCDDTIVLHIHSSTPLPFFKNQFYNAKISEKNYLVKQLQKRCLNAIFFVGLNSLNAFICAAFVKQTFVTLIL